MRLAFSYLFCDISLKFSTCVECVIVQKMKKELDIIQVGLNLFFQYGSALKMDKAEKLS